MMRTAPDIEIAGRDSERGSALVLALMVALVMLFLGMGLALQTFLGLQAAGTDRWVVKALYAADAGAMMQIEMIKVGHLTAPAAFLLTDDAALPGLLRGQYQVTVSEFCESQPPTLIPGSQVDMKRRSFHLRSDSTRAVRFVSTGIQEGLSQAAVEVDVAAQPFLEENWVFVNFCWGDD